MEIVYTLNALIDLDGIKEYISEVSSREIASQFIEQMTDKISEVLSFFPYAGSSRDDLPKGLRLFRYKNYIALYVVNEDAEQVIIEAIRHGRRDRGGMFEQ